MPRKIFDMGEHYEKINREIDDVDFPYTRGECVIDMDDYEKSLIHPHYAVIHIGDKDPQDAGFFLKKLDIVTGDVVYYRANDYNGKSLNFIKQNCIKSAEDNGYTIYPLNTDPKLIKVYLLVDVSGSETELLEYKPELIYDGSASRDIRIAQLTAMMMHKTFFREDEIRTDLILDDLDEALAAYQNNLRRIVHVNTQRSRLSRRFYTV